MKIRILDVDDWVGLYIDDVLVMQGHELRVDEVIKIIAPDADFGTTFVYELPDGSCPKKWTEEYEEQVEREED